jgi:hypothetical protein
MASLGSAWETALRRRLAAELAGRKAGPREPPWRARGRESRRSPESATEAEWQEKQFFWRMARAWSGEAERAAAGRRKRR